MSRRLNRGEVPGAERVGNSWSVPVEGLLAAGYPVNRSRPEQGETFLRVADKVAGAITDQRVTELEQQLRDERHRRELAETRERGLERLVEQLRGDLDYQRALMPGGAGGISVPGPAADVPTSLEPERKRPRWWGLRRG